VIRILPAAGRDVKQLAPAAGGFVEFARKSENTGTQKLVPTDD